MNRRALLAFGIPLATMAASGARAESHRHKLADFWPAGALMPFPLPNFFFHATIRSASASLG